MGVELYLFELLLNLFNLSLVMPRDILEYEFKNYCLEIFVCRFQAMKALETRCKQD